VLLSVHLPALSPWSLALCNSNKKHNNLIATMHTVPVQWKHWRIQVLPTINKTHHCGRHMVVYNMEIG